MKIKNFQTGYWSNAQFGGEGVRVLRVSQHCHLRKGVSYSTLEVGEQSQNGEQGGSFMSKANCLPGTQILEASSSDPLSEATGKIVSSKHSKQMSTLYLLLAIYQ